MMHSDKRKVIVLGHLGMGAAATVSGIIKNMGLEPIIISTPIVEHRDAILQAWTKQELEFDIVDVEQLTLDDVFSSDKINREEIACCVAIWEGQRGLMAEINQEIGANDVSRDVVLFSQDKYRLRRLLSDKGISSCLSYSLSDVDGKDLSKFFEKGPLVVKPKRGTGSLLTQVVKSEHELTECLDRFKSQREDPLFSEFLKENELYLESFVHGDEHSFEVVMQEGEVIFFCEHEKVLSQHPNGTILESACCSPSVCTSPKEVKPARDVIQALLSVSELETGCYHVEMKYTPERHWELIEINPRIGGAFIYESVLHQYDYCMVKAWVETLLNMRQSQQQSDRLCGTYFEVCFAEPAKHVSHYELNDKYPEPDEKTEMLSEGSITPKSDREIFAAMYLWKISTADYENTISRFKGDAYSRIFYKESISCEAKTELVV